MDFNFFNFFSAIVLIKIVTLIAIGFYIIFTFVVFTQVRVMEKILVLSSAKAVIKAISIINIVLAISLFVIAIVIL